MKAPRLYLAGPEVFRADARVEGKRLKQAAARLGAEGIYPLDGETLGSAGDIKRRCRDMIDEADAVVANISPFRGHHMDPGTAWEIGYAEARRKEVHLWSTDPRTLQLRIPSEPTGEMRIEWRDAEGHLVEDFDLQENLMITAGGGPVWSTPEEAMRAAVESVRREQFARAGRRRLLWVALAVIGFVALASLSIAAYGAQLL